MARLTNHIDTRHKNETTRKPNVSKAKNKRAPQRWLQLDLHDRTSVLYPWRNFPIYGKSPTVSHKLNQIISNYRLIKQFRRKKRGAYLVKTQRQLRASFVHRSF